MELVLCFLGYLLLNLEAAAFAPMRRISFRVFGVAVVHVSGFKISLTANEREWTRIVAGGGFRF